MSYKHMPLVIFPNGLCVGLFWHVVCVWPQIDDVVLLTAAKTSGTYVCGAPFPPNGHDKVHLLHSMSHE